MSRPKGSKNKVKKQKNYTLPIRKLKKRGRPKGSKNNPKNQDNSILQPEQAEEKRHRGRPKGSIEIKKQYSFPSHYIPYEKSKKDKTGNIITYQTYKSGDVWLIDILTNGDLTLKGFDASIVKLGDAIRFIDSEIARL